MISVISVSCTQTGTSGNDELINPSADQSSDVLIKQIRAVTESIEDDPDNAVLYATRGRLYLNGEENRKALIDAKKGGGVRHDQSRILYFARSLP